MVNKNFHNGGPFAAERTIVTELDLYTVHVYSPETVANSKKGGKRKKYTKANYYRAMLAQSAVMRLHVVRLSVCL